MLAKQHEKERNYRLSLYLAKMLLNKKNVTEHEYERTRKKLLKKYKPPFGELW
jgi:dynactin complex subunit